MTQHTNNPTVLDGRSLAKEIEQELALRVKALKEKRGGMVPVLATILVGGDPSSATYVRMKDKACERVGMESLKVALPEETTTEGPRFSSNAGLFFSELLCSTRETDRLQGEKDELFATKIWPWDCLAQSMVDHSRPDRCAN